MAAETGALASDGPQGRGLLRVEGPARPSGRYAGAAHGRVGALWDCLLSAPAPGAAALDGGGRPQPLADA